MSRATQIAGSGGIVLSGGAFGYPFGLPVELLEAPARLAFRRTDPGLRLVSEPISQTVKIERVKNASGWASTFKSRWITTGLVNYNDPATRGGVGFVSKEAIDKSMQSMVGRPLVIKHEPVSRKNGVKLDPVTPTNMEEVACGYISRVWWGEDGWAWCEGTVHDDEAKGLIKNGWRVSCCYARSPGGTAGVLNGMPYNFEVKSFTGEHLALHPNPRYEGATIVMNGKSTSAKSTTMKFTLFGIGKTNAAPDAAAVAAKAAADKKVADDATAEALRLANATPSTEITAETPVTIEGVDGTVPFGELVEAYNTLKNGMEMDPDQEIEYAEGKRAKMGMILKHYANAMGGLEEENKGRIAAVATTGVSGLSFTKNGVTVAKTPAELEAEKTAAANRKGGEKSPNYLRLVNASSTAVDPLQAQLGKSIETQEARIARGKARWGKPKQIGSGSN